jgi:hypothetical protein
MALGIGWMLPGDAVPSEAATMIQFGAKEQGLEKGRDVWDLV